MPILPSIETYSEQDTPVISTVCAAASADMFFQLNCIEKYTSDLFPVPHTDDVSVVNLSDCPLSEACMSLLRKGLKFCPTPPAPAMGDLRRDMDDFHRRVKLCAHFNEPDVSHLPAKPVGRPRKSASQSTLSTPSVNLGQLDNPPTLSLGDNTVTRGPRAPGGRGSAPAAPLLLDPLAPTSTGTSPYPVTGSPQIYHLLSQPW